MRIQRMLVVIAVVSLAASVPAAKADPVGDLLAHNLIVNPDAEAGPRSSSGYAVVEVPGWTTEGQFTVVSWEASGGFPEPNDPGPLDRGEAFFAGGPATGYSHASQTIDVSDVGSLIDRGTVLFVLSGYLGGYAAQEDNAMLVVSFLDASGTAIGNSSIGPVTAAERGSQTGLWYRANTGTVPPGTRAVLLDLRMTRAGGGGYNDGYAESLFFGLCDPTDLTQCG